MGREREQKRKRNFYWKEIYKQVISTENERQKDSRLSTSFVIVHESIEFILSKDGYQTK